MAMIKIGFTVMKVYFLKIALRGISPMVWRRLRVPSVADATL